MWWTRWYLDGFDLTDPLFPGAAVLRVPYAMLGAVSVIHAETPGGTRHDGVHLSTRTGITNRLHSGISVTIPELGGITPLGKEITRTFSTTHPTDRQPTPPAERRRFTDHLRIWTTNDLPLDEDLHLTYGFDVDRGGRNYLAFAAPSGDFAETFRDGFLIASAAARVDSRRGDWRAYLLGEFRTRDHLFAELGHARAETADFDRGVIFAGLAGDRSGAAITFQRASLAHADPEFTRELIDPDGESLNPYFPDGQVTALTVQLHHGGELFYGSARAELFAFSPARSTWKNQLTLNGAPFGEIEHQSRPALETAADPRAGLRGSAPLGLFELDYDLFVSAAFAERLFLPDLGAALALRVQLDEAFIPFVLLAKTPLPIDMALVRKLDPHWLDSRLPFDRRGGANIDVAHDLTRANLYSAALGFESRFGGGWRFEAQGLFRAYHDTYILELADPPEVAGYFVEDRYYFHDADHRYRLTNYSRQLPFYAGLELQLARVVEDRFLFSAGFTTHLAVGETALGNGPTSNDLGVVDESTANPNTRANALANLDGDRAFALKLLLGARLIDELWIFTTARHKDGQAFAFTEITTDGGRAAIAHASKRGSPLHPGRPLLGPREDFQLEVDVELQYRFILQALDLRLRALVTNLFDLGNELAERQNEVGRNTRAALELQVPRALQLTAELLF